jgi:hypothetical protein
MEPIDISSEFIRINYFKSRLEKVKREVGKSLTHLSFVSEKGDYFFKVNLVNSAGGKDKITIKIKGTIEELEQKDYDELAEILKTRSYAN